jgi:hypothetical protein
VKYADLQKMRTQRRGSQLGIGAMLAMREPESRLSLLLSEISAAQEAWAVLAYWLHMQSIPAEDGSTATGGWRIAGAADRRRILDVSTTRMSRELEIKEVTDIVRFKASPPCFCAAGGCLVGWRGQRPFSYGVVEVDSVVEAVAVGTMEGAAWMRTVRVVVDVRPALSVAT